TTSARSETCGRAPAIDARSPAHCLPRHWWRPVAPRTGAPGSSATGSRTMRPDRPPHEFAEVHQPRPHDSAKKHVTGAATYVDDIREPAGLLHVVPGWARDHVRGKVRSLGLDEVRAAPGVVAVLTAEDIPGRNDCSPSLGDDPVLAEGEIQFFGQVLFA